MTCPRLVEDHEKSFQRWSRGPSLQQSQSPALVSCPGRHCDIRGQRRLNNYEAPHLALESWPLGLSLPRDRQPSVPWTEKIVHEAAADEIGFMFPCH